MTIAATPSLAGITAMPSSANRLATGSPQHPDAQRRELSSQERQKGVEFLASTNDFVNHIKFSIGPDGTLYVVDMSRAVVEHPQWIPLDVQKKIDVRAGLQRSNLQDSPERWLARGQAAWKSNLPPSWSRIWTTPMPGGD